MATAATDSLIAQATCIDSCIPEGMKLSVLIAVFARLAGMPTDTNSLISAATCIDSCIPQGYKLSVLVSLASQLLSGGSGSSLAQVFCGTGSPATGNAVPNPGNPVATCAIWIQSDSVPPNQTTAIWINGSWQ